MTDVLREEQRSYCMSRIRSKDTKPEMVVRRLLHAMGYRYRLHYRDLPGCPDIVLPRYKLVIFVHGCFWHRHDCKLGSPKPKQNHVFWENKLSGNVVRDKRNIELLEADGWRVLVIWQCETKNIDILRDILERFLK